MNMEIGQFPHSRGNGSYSSLVDPHHGDPELSKQLDKQLPLTYILTVSGVTGCCEYSSFIQDQMDPFILYHILDQFGQFSDHLQINFVSLFQHHNIRKDPDPGILFDDSFRQSK
jgi:hypothetical protein